MLPTDSKEWSKAVLKMTPQVKRRIGKDWLSAFPGMGLYKPMWLMRRVGPLLVGIVLDGTTGNEDYRPKFHIHVLGTGFEVISLSLCTPLRMRPDSGETWIRAKWHYNDWEAATRVIHAIALLPLEGDVALSAVAEAYASFMDRNGAEKSNLYNYESLIVLSSWCGLTEQAQVHLEAGMQALASWPKSDRQRAETYQNFNEEEWYEQQSALANSPELVRKRVAEMLAKDLKLQNLPVAELLSE